MKSRFQKIPKQKFGPMGEKLCRWCEGEIVKGSGRRTFCSDSCVHEARLRSDGKYLRACVELRDRGVCGKCGIDTIKLASDYRILWAVSRSGLRANVSLASNIWVRYGIKRHRWNLICDAITREQADRLIGEVRSRAMSNYESRLKAGYKLVHPDQDQHVLAEMARINNRAIELTKAEVKVIALERRLIRLASARLKRVTEKLIADGFKPTGGHLHGTWEADHIKPVEQGGGACGLDNMMTLCTPCHRSKTAIQAAEKAKRRRNG